LKKLFKTISFLIILITFSRISVLASSFEESNSLVADPFRIADEDTLELIENLEADMYIDNGHIHINQNALKEKVTNTSSRIKIEEVLKQLNNKVDNGDLTFSNKETRTSIEPFSATSVSEIRQNIFCLSKAQLITFRNNLKNNMPSTWPAWVLSTPLSVLGLIVPGSGVVTFVLATTFSLAGAGGSAVVIEDLTQQIFKMNDNQYNVLNLRQEYYFPTLTRYLNNNPSNITTNKLNKGTVVNYRVPNKQLYLYK